MENHGSVSSSVPEVSNENDEDVIDGEVGNTKKDNKIENVEVDDKEILLLDAIKDNPKITTKELSERTSLPLRTTQRYMAKLRDKEIIVRVGSTKSGSWKVINS